VTAGKITVIETARRLTLYPIGPPEFSVSGTLVGCGEPWHTFDCLRGFAMSVSLSGAIAASPSTNPTSPAYG